MTDRRNTPEKGEDLPLPEYRRPELRDLGSLADLTSTEAGEGSDAQELGAS